MVESKTLAATVAVVALLYNILFVAVCQYLPDDPLYVGTSITGYAWVACALSTLGLIGVLNKRPTLCTSFAHYLLVDTLLSTICRVVLLELFIDTFTSDQDICVDAYPLPTSPSQEQSLPNNASWQHYIVRRRRSGIRRCRIAISAVQVVLVALLIFMTAMQGMLAVAMRRYGKEIERIAVEGMLREEDEEVWDEKQQEVVVLVEEKA